MKNVGSTTGSAHSSGSLSPRARGALPLAPTRCARPLQVCAFASFRQRGREGGERGFTLLLAALVASIVLALGASIFSLASKEVALSSLGRDSQFAFYAADTGAECALYWDSRYQYFGTSTAPGLSPVCDTQTLQTPSGGDMNAQRLPVYPNCPQAQVMTFQFVPNGLCTTVSVSKCIDTTTHAVKTTVHADGTNVTSATASSCGQAISQSNRALQRSVELHY